MPNFVTYRMMTSLHFAHVKTEVTLRSLPATARAEKCTLGLPEIDIHSSCQPLKLHTT